MHHHHTPKDLTGGERYLFNRKEGHEKTFYTNKDVAPFSRVCISLRDLKKGPTPIPVSSCIVKNFMKQLAKNGTLSKAGFSVEDIMLAQNEGHVPEGFTVEQIVPGGCGARPTPNNLCLMENGLSEYLMRHLWRYFHQDLQAEKTICEKKGKPLEQITISLSGFQSVMRINDWKKTLDKSLLRRSKEVEEELKIQKLKEMDLIILSTNNSVLLAHPVFLEKDNGFFSNSCGLKPAIINVRLTSSSEQQKLKFEYTEKRRDIIRTIAGQGKLPEIRLNKQKDIASSGWLPKNYAYTCHHVVPRALGGNNDVENMCWLQASDHAHLHVIVNRYQHELKTNYKYLATRGDAYLLLPVPASFNGPQLRVISPFDMKLVSVTELTTRLVSEYCHQHLMIKGKHKKSKRIRYRMLVCRCHKKHAKQKIDLSHIHM